MSLHDDVCYRSIKEELLKRGLTASDLDVITHISESSKWPCNPFPFLVLTPKQKAGLVGYESWPKAFYLLSRKRLGLPTYESNQDIQRYVDETIWAKQVLVGERSRANQRVRARKPRPRRIDEGKTVDDVTGCVFARHKDASAKVLWRYFVRELEDDNRHPVETGEADNLRKLTCEFETAKGHHVIAFTTFSNKVSKLRS